MTGQSNAAAERSYGHAAPAEATRSPVVEIRPGVEQLGCVVLRDRRIVALEAEIERLRARCVCYPAPEAAPAGWDELRNCR